MLARRDVMIGLAGVVLATTAKSFANPSADGSLGGEPLRQAIRAAETQGGGRLGVAILDRKTDRRFAWRGDERFPLCSTFKFVLAGAVLAEVDRGRAHLEHRIAIAASDLVDYAPVTGKHVGADGLTVAELCAAAIVWSDNAAANLLLRLVGGSAGLTGFARELGDAQFRLDRIETALGEATPGDPRDTTTPQAMLADLDRLLLGAALSPASRTLLTDWLVASRTGDQKIRAGLPGDWRAGDKSGAGGYGSTNDIAILWPPGRQPILVTTYLTETAAPLEARNAALADVGRAIAQSIADRPTE